MNDRISMMRKAFVTDKIQKKNWTELDDKYCLAKGFAEKHVSDIDRSVARLCFVLDNESAVIYPFERITFTRTQATIPELFTEEEEKTLRRKYHLHEKGDVSNISVDYTKLLGIGFSGMKQKLESLIAQSNDEKKTAYWHGQIQIIESILNLMRRYIKKAQEEGNETVATTMQRLLEHAPETLLEAMQAFRIIHFTMWAGRNYHNTLGRLDQYLYPYYRFDVENNHLDQDSALELLEEFFLSFNRDSDLYPGMQQGDNGQSLVLGGYADDGDDLFNDFSALCLRSSLELKLIDPKINLRVNKNTPLERYVLGTKLTKQGLGFPQYSSDDIVVKGLEDLGYERKDALNYVVAACWEFIIPGKAMDIPNIEALSFAKVVRTITMNELEKCTTFEDFLTKVKQGIEAEAEQIVQSIKPVYIFPSPFISLMMEGCTENARDISLGCKYNNYGLHGTGIATAVDSIANIKKFIFDEKKFSSEELINALDTDFKSNERLGNELRYSDEKLGNDTELTDTLASYLLESFSGALKGKKNDRGGVYRAGTGSAMFYIWHARTLGATPDGRKEGEPFPANYSPSLFAKIKGPVSIIKSFARPDLECVINGGPLTIEIHDSVFRNDEGLEKVAMLIKSYFDLGGHQLQINTVNREILLDAQKHPSDYRNLIVRVWGWSGYFVELDKCYQDHIIKRIELAV